MTQQLDALIYGDAPADLGAGALEIDVTPAMIEAGVRELAEWRYLDDPRQIVREVFAAMWLEHLRLGNQ